MWVFPLLLRRYLSKEKRNTRIHVEVYISVTDLLHFCPYKCRIPNAGVGVCVLVRRSQPGRAFGNKFLRSWEDQGFVVAYASQQLHPSLSPAVSFWESRSRSITKKGLSMVFSSCVRST